MTPGVSVPRWTGVALSVLLVVLVAGLAYHPAPRAHPAAAGRFRSGRRAARRGGCGAACAVSARRAGGVNPGRVVVMVAVGGQVAGRHDPGVPLARVAATVGIAAGTGLTLSALLALSIIATTPRVVLSRSRLHRQHPP